MRFFLKHILRSMVGDQAWSNYQVPLVQCGQCDGFVPLLRSTLISVFGSVFCKECRNTLSIPFLWCQAKRKR